MQEMRVVYMLLIANLSTPFTRSQENTGTCSGLISKSLDIQCQRGFRAISCEERMLPGSKGNLACKPEYQLNREPEFTQVTCGDDGIWDNCLFSCEVECGNPTPMETIFKINPPVIYLAGEFPWHVIIYKKYDTLFNFHCGATIINNKMAITVTSCISQENINDLILTAGSSISKWNMTEDAFAKHYTIEKIIVQDRHELQENRSNNIAIIVIKEEFIFNQFVKPICLHRSGSIEELAEGIEGYLPGFDNRGSSEPIHFVKNITLAHVAQENWSINQKGSGYILPKFVGFNEVHYLRGIVSEQGTNEDFLVIVDVHPYITWILKQEQAYLNEESNNTFCGPAAKANASASLHAEGSCNLPSKPSNGRYFLLGFKITPSRSYVPEFSIVKYECDRGYTIRGSEISLCNEGSWSNIPQCIKMCKPLTSFSLNITCSLNGENIPCQNPVPAGTIADMRCKIGYTLHYIPDSTRITCAEDGIWDASPFKCTPECGLPTPKANSLIGLIIETSDYPWYAGIYERDNRTTSNNKQICGGTIVNAKMVITAAHCFYSTGISAPSDKRNYNVAVGKIYKRYHDQRDVYSQYNNVDQLVIHPNYQDTLGNYASDIAIVILQFALEFTPYVRPICVQWDFRGHEEELKPGTQGLVSGWNLSTEPSEKLKTISLPSISRLQCKENLPDYFRPYLTLGKFCAGFQNGTGVSTGNSGGGLSFPKNIGGKNVYFLRGVISMVPIKDGICDTSQYVVFTSVLDNLEWVKNVRAHLSV